MLLFFKVLQRIQMTNDFEIVSKKKLLMSSLFVAWYGIFLLFKYRFMVIELWNTYWGSWWSRREDCTSPSSRIPWAQQPLTQPQCNSNFQSNSFSVVKSSLFSSKSESCKYLSTFLTLSKLRYNLTIKSDTKSLLSL